MQRRPKRRHSIYTLVLSLALSVPLVRSSVTVQELHYFANDTILFWECMTSKPGTDMVILDMNDVVYVKYVQLDSSLEGDDKLFLDIGTECCLPSTFPDDCYLNCQRQNDVTTLTQTFAQFNCSDVIYGRYLRLVRHESRQCLETTGNMSTLRAADVHIFGLAAWYLGEINLALNKPASQSSSFYYAHAKRAVDGNTNGVFWGRSCSHTDLLGSVQWWEVDLQLAFPIHHLEIFNRVDCCGDRLSNISIEVGRFENSNSSNITYESCATIEGPLGSRAMIECRYSPCGQFVRIVKPGRVYLTLCEVEVYINHSSQRMTTEESVSGINPTQTTEDSVSGYHITQATEEAVSCSHAEESVSGSHVTQTTEESISGSHVTQTTEESISGSHVTQTDSSVREAQLTTIETYRTFILATVVSESGTSNGKIPTGIPAAGTSNVKVTTGVPETGTNKAKVATGDPETGTNKAKITTGVPETGTNKAKVATGDPETGTNKAKVAAGDPEIGASNVRIVTAKTKCPCSCTRYERKELTNSSQSQMQEIREQIKTLLLVSRDTLSQQTRRKQSARDSRESAFGGGIIAIAILGICALAIVVPDCIELMCNVWELFHRKQSHISPTHTHTPNA